MPYKSKAQVGYMHVHHPEIAERWDKKYGVKKGLPRHVGDRRKKKSRQGTEVAPGLYDSGERILD